MNDRLTGCIPAKLQAEQAACMGVASDEQKIINLAAPWDGFARPSIIRWDTDWETWLTSEAEAFDGLRRAGQLKPVWEIARDNGYNLEQLCMTTQRRNDCTAWGTSRAAICLGLYQVRLGMEADVEKLNPSGIYVYSSGDTPREGQRVADNGRTIYSIAKTACNVGNFTAATIGDYTGETWYTEQMLQAVKDGDAEQNQIGFVYLGSQPAETLADRIILSLRACRPAIIGNDIALRDGTRKDSNGVYISDVGGSWGGGHCTAAVDYKNVNGKDYVWIYNSHGNIYPSGDGSPAAGTYVTREGLIRYLSGSFADVMLTTYVERPRLSNSRYKECPV